MVTSTPDRALADLPGGISSVVVKSLGRHAVEVSPGQFRGVLPRLVPRRELAAEQGTEPAPVPVQEYVSAPQELRIYVVDSRLIGYAVTRPSPQALWTDPASIGVRRYPVPETVAGALVAIATELGLDVAAFDLLDAAAGPYTASLGANLRRLSACRTSVRDREPPRRCPTEFE